MGDHRQSDEQTQGDEIETLQAECAALREKLANKTALVGEVEHRAKNVLSMASALLRAQAASAQDPDARHALKSASHRLNALAEVHAALYASGKDSVCMADYLRGLAAGLQSPESRIDIVIDCDNVNCAPQMAPLIGLLVNEAVTNALKHAYQADSIGRITIRLQRSEQDNFRLMVEDDGKGLPPQVAMGLGFKVIRMLARQIRGEAYFEPVSPTGLRVVVIFPGGRRFETRKRD